MGVAIVYFCQANTHSFPLLSNIELVTRSLFLPFLSNAYLLPVLSFVLISLRLNYCHKFSDRLAGEPEPGNAIC